MASTSSGDLLTLRRSTSSFTGRSVALPETFSNRSDSATLTACASNPRVATPAYSPSTLSTRSQMSDCAISMRAASPTSLAACAW